MQICPRGVTCCTPEMESKLWTLTRESFTSSLSSTTKPLQALFQTKSRLFSGNIYFFILFQTKSRLFSGNIYFFILFQTKSRLFSGSIYFFILFPLNFFQKFGKHKFVNISKVYLCLFHERIVFTTPPPPSIS